MRERDLQSIRRNIITTQGPEVLGLFDRLDDWGKNYPEMNIRSITNRNISISSAVYLIREKIKRGLINIEWVKDDGNLDEVDMAHEFKECKWRGGLIVGVQIKLGDSCLDSYFFHDLADRKRAQQAIGFLYNVALCLGSEV